MSIHSYTLVIFRVRPSPRRHSDIITGISAVLYNRVSNDIPSNVTFILYTDFSPVLLRSARSTNSSLPCILNYIKLPISQNARIKSLVDQLRESPGSLILDNHNASAIIDLKPQGLTVRRIEYSKSRFQSCSNRTGKL